MDGKNSSPSVLYLSYHRNYNIPVRIARYHNIYGPESTWEGGREKAPAAICRKVANACDEDSIEVWGDGHQTRSFLYIDECIEATCRLMDSECTEPHQHWIRGDGYDKSVGRYRCRDCWKEDN